LIFNGTGLVKDGLYITGFAWSPTYLFVAEQPVLFEAGFCCMGRIYERDIRRILALKSPEILFLTHVHYDHCGAASYFKKVFPGLKIAASRRAAEIIKRPNAQKLMISLSQNAIHLIAPMEGIDEGMLMGEPFEPFEVDMILKEGQIINLKKNLSVQVFAAPGHTRDMFSYYIPERKMLIATETAGCLGQTGNIVSDFLVDYDGYMASLKRLAALDVEVLCQGHHFVFVGKSVKDFFARSIDAAEDFKVKVERLLRVEGGSIDRVVNLIKAEEYDTNPGPKQPEPAYLINLKTRVTHLAERLQWQKGSRGRGAR